MPLRSKDRAAIRADALRMMRQKEAENCEPCARQFEELARQHGASEADIAKALAEPWDARFTRRALLESAAVVAGSAIATYSLLPYAGASAAAVSTTVGAWAISISPTGSASADKPTSPAGPYNLTSYGSDASAVGQLQNVVNTVARTPDGGLIAIVSPLWTGSGFASRIEICDGKTGAQITVITGETMPQETGSDATQHMEPYLSPDGTMLALARMQYDIFGAPQLQPAKQPGTVSAGRMTYKHALEVIDLNGRRSMGMVGFPSVPGHLPSGEHLAWTPDSRGLYLFSRRYIDPSFFLTVTAFHLAGSSLQLASTATSIETAETFAAFDGPIRFPQRITPDGTRLVRYTPGRLAWYSLSPWSAAQTLERPIPWGFGKRPPIEIAAFSAGADRLFLANPSTGAVSAIDTHSGVTTHTAQLPLRPGQSTQPREPFALSTTRNTAALSADGRTLYVADNRGLTGGVWAVNTGSLQVVGTLFDGHTISAVVEAPDGTVYGLSRIEQRLHCSSGSSNADGVGAVDFLRPGSVGSGE